MNGIGALSGLMRWQRLGEGARDAVPWSGQGAGVSGFGMGACLEDRHLTLGRSASGSGANISLKLDEHTHLISVLRVAFAAQGVPEFGRAKCEAGNEVSTS